MQARTVQTGRGFLWAALVLGLVHAFWSFYWAFGGTWMLDTVGQWAVVSQLHQPVANLFRAAEHRVGQNSGGGHSRCRRIRQAGW